VRHLRRDDAGLTRVKLLVVVAIVLSAFVLLIGIVVAIAIPVYLNYTRSANDRSAQTDLRRAVSVLETCISDNGRYPALDARWTATTPVCGGNGQQITVTDGTTLTYRAVGSGASYLLFGTNSHGRPAYYCYRSAAGGSVQTRTVSATTACP